MDGSSPYNLLNVAESIFTCDKNLSKDAEVFDEGTLFLDFARLFYSLDLTDSL